MKDYADLHTHTIASGHAYGTITELVHAAALKDLPILGITEHAPSMPVEKEGVVFGSTKNGLMFGLDAHTGKVLWKHKVGNSLISTLVPLSKNKCLFTATGGEIGLLVIDYKTNKHK